MEAGASEGNGAKDMTGCDKGTLPSGHCSAAACSPECPAMTHAVTRPQCITRGKSQDTLGWLMLGVWVTEWARPEVTPRPFHA